MALTGWQNFLLTFAENARLAFERLILPHHKRQRAQLNQNRNRWYYRADWQRLEHEAEADLREGRYEDFRDVGELMTVLRQNNTYAHITDVSESASNFDRIAAALRHTARRVPRHLSRRNES
jgi:hypothetical protein